MPSRSKILKIPRNRRQASNAGVGCGLKMIFSPVLGRMGWDGVGWGGMGLGAGAGAGDWGGGGGGAGQESVNPDKGTAKWDSDKCVLEVSPGRRRRRRRRRLYRAHGGGGEGRLPGS